MKLLEENKELAERIHSEITGGKPDPEEATEGEETAESPAEE